MESQETSANLVAVTIRAVHPAGYGIGQTETGARLSFRVTLPGEMVMTRAAHAETAERAGKLLLDSDEIIELKNPSPDRVVPPCPYFGECGGCSLQHWSLNAAADFKRERIVQALAKAGFHDAPVAPTIAIAPGLRRRMDLAVKREGAVVKLGLHVQGSSNVVDLSSCLALEPALTALFDPLRACLRGISAFRQNASVIANRVESGIDILLRLDGPVTADDRKRLANFARDAGVMRIALGHGMVRGKPAPAEILVNNGAVFTVFDGTQIALPPGAFLQPSREGETAIRAEVVAALSAQKLPARPVVSELYAGNGTLSFGIGKVARVRAYEGDETASAAINRAASGGQINAQCRDLTRQPLQKTDFAGSCAIVLDPPFDGAGLQIPPIAQSDVTVVIYVSCNPLAMTRDLTLLANAGFTVARAAPIDQFPWTTEIEAVITLVRAKRARDKRAG